MTAKIALITDAGSGIGRAVALALAKVGYTVVLAGRRLPQLEQVAREAGSGAVGITADVTDPDSVDELFARIANDFGRLDLLFNNAGISGSAEQDFFSTEAWHRIMAVNATGTFFGIKHAIPAMRASGGGSIGGLNGSGSSSVPAWAAA